MTLAEQTGLSRLLGEKVHIAEPRIKSGAANPAPKLVSVVAGMCVGADCIDDIDAVRSGGMTTLFDGVYAPSTVERCGGSSPSVTSNNSNRCSASTWWRRASGSICCPEPVRTCSANRLAAAPGLRACQTGCLLRAHQDRRHTILRKGLSALATTISTPGSAPVTAGPRRRAGRANSGRVSGAWSPKRSAPPAPPEPAPRSGPWRFGVRQPRGGGRVCPTWRAIFVSDDPQRGHRAGDRRHRRPRLERQRRPMKEFECARDSLEKIRSVVFRGLIGRPGDVAHLGDRRESVIDLSWISLRLWG
jgi:hypothetical protein